MMTDKSCIPDLQTRTQSIARWREVCRKVDLVTLKFDELIAMPKYTFTSYFKNDVLTKRPYLKKEWCIYVIENPIRCEPQEDNRFRFWAKIEEFGDRYLRVVTLADKITIHNTFPDRSFKP
jgi:hypothetical protein